jgi:hypothetical protein
MTQTITVFCGSKLTINKSLTDGVEDLFNILGNDFKYAYGRRV